LKKKALNILKYLLFAGGGVFLLYKVLEGQDFDSFLAIVDDTKWAYILLSVLCGYIAFVSRGIRWMQLLRPMGMDFKTIHAINAINFGYFANLLIPRIGEVARCTILGKKVGAPVDKLLGTVILERVIDTLLLMCLFATVALLKADDFFVFLGENVVLPSTNKLIVFGVSGVVLLVAVALFFRRWRKRTTWAPLLKLIEWLKGLKDGIQSIKEVERRGEFIFHTFTIWFMYFLMTYLCFSALPAMEHLTVEDGLFIMLAGGIGMVIPAPGGIGAYHYVVITSLVFIGIENDVATAFATIVHSAQTLMVLLTGIMASAMLYVIKRKVAPDGTK
jgi:uncharacterized protein (TIRG00374 family)